MTNFAGSAASMPEMRGKPTFGEIYREQYRQVSSSTTSRVSRVLAPLSLVVSAWLGVKFHTMVIPIILGAVAIVLFIVTFVVTRRRRR
jgi:hypothetical protein